MSKAVYLETHGGPEGFVLRDHDLPAPGFGQIQLRHHAIGLNFIDIYQRKGLYPVALPGVLGSEAAGVVEAIGDGVTGFAPGDRVACLHSSGAYAERANGAAVLCWLLSKLRCLDTGAPILSLLSIAVKSSDPPRIKLAAE